MRNAAAAWHDGRLWVSLAAAVLSAACNSVGPSFERDGLRATITLEPAVVRVDDQFMVRVDLVNRTDRLIELFRAECPFNYAVEPGRRHDFRPPDTFVCIWKPDTIPAGGQLTHRLPLIARVSPGSFDVKVALNQELPPLRAKLEVVE